MKPSDTATKPLTSIADFRGEFEPWLATYLEQQTKRAEQIGPGVVDLWQAIQQVTMAGGKRVRPYLVRLAYEAFGGQDAAAIMPIAASQEILHQCLLIHDDIIDRDTIRHGQPNVTGVMNAKYQPLSDDHLHYAESAALLAGDLLLSAAYQLVAEAVELAPETRLALVRLLGDAIFTVGGGQLLDTETVLYPIEHTQPLPIARNKSAHYSFSTPLLCGAELANATTDNKRLLNTFGESLGIAFQLRDDVLGMFGDDTVTGKTAIGDIREGKHTLLMQHALANASATDVATIQTAFANPAVSAEQAAAVRGSIKRTGSLDYVESLIQEYLQASQRALDELHFPPETEAYFRQLIQQQAERQH